MKDFLGRELSVGDHIVWATMSGRSVQMTYGVFEGMTDKGQARVTKLDGSRWGSSKPYDGWVDSRTGKQVRENSKTHQKSPEYYIREDGLKFTWEEKLAYIYDCSVDELHLPVRQPWNDPGVEARRKEFSYDKDRRIPPIMKDYCVRAEVKPTVTLQITSNIVKVEPVADPS